MRQTSFSCLPTSSLDAGNAWNIGAFPFSASAERLRPHPSRSYLLLQTSRFPPHQPPSGALPARGEAEEGAYAFPSTLTISISSPKRPYKRWVRRTADYVIFATLPSSLAIL